MDVYSHMIEGKQVITGSFILNKTLVANSPVSY